jgi:hypothetical protein
LEVVFFPPLNAAMSPPNNAKAAPPTAIFVPVDNGFDSFVTMT